MSFEIQFEREGLGVLVTASGTVVAADIHETFAKVWSRPEAAQLRYHIIHVTDDSTFQAGLAELRGIGMLIPETLKISPSVCTAIVTGSVVMMGTIKLAAAFGIAIAKSPRLHLCWSMEEARQWVERQCPDIVLSAS